jgi:hypothetical protein
MKFRIGLVIGAALGYAAANWMRGNGRAAAPPPRRNAASRLVTGASRRVATRAHGASLDALQRARSTIRSRLGEGPAV